jgi:hypothetical protein
MEVEAGVWVFAAQILHHAGEALWNVAVTDVFAHDRTVL